VAGPRTAKSRIANWYIARLHVAAAQDSTLANAFVRVAAMVDRPEALFRPDITLRMLRAMLHPSLPSTTSGGDG
jgi:hypothetical protein